MKFLKDYKKYQAKSLILHEANPGHHYQNTYVNENNKIPKLMNIIDSDGYTEGWALYTENLGDYTSYKNLLGKYIMEMLRSVRLVIDTGIHYYGWNYEKCFNFCKLHLFENDEQIKNQLNRYIVLPGQALCYKIGEKVILDLLNIEVEKDNFNIKNFHEKILENGALSLEILKEKFSLMFY